MKPIKYYVGISALALMSMAPMYAQMNSLQVNVPFAFTVGSEKMPAGAYMVQTSESGLVMLQGSGHAVTFLSTPFETRGRPAHPSLVFERRSGSVSLVRVQNDSTGASRLLSSSSPSGTAGLQSAR